MVHAVQITGTQGEGCDTGWKRLGSHGYNMREVSLPISNQIEGLGSGVLAPVAPERPLTTDAGK